MDSGADGLQNACSVIIVTHNNQTQLPRCIQALKAQTQAPEQIIIVDSGSKDSTYLSAYAQDSSIILHLSQENVGFCKGNNIGMSYVNVEVNFVLFLNPDAFLTPSFLEEAFRELSQQKHRSVGAFSGILLGYDLEKGCPSGKIDSTGIFRTWYGRWFDRGQGEEFDSKRYSSAENVPALCGALMLCRLEALRSVEFEKNVVMDPSFFMYKEDIDLSHRLQKKGWKLLFQPGLMAYHCRGWNSDRSKVSKKLRLQSAKNEVRLNARMGSACVFYSMLKYFLVRTCNW